MLQMGSNEEPTELEVRIPDRRPVRRGVIGIIAEGSRLLAIRRAAGVAKGGAWCFPGGHVELRETPRQAIVRELFEELGVHVRPVRRVGAVRVIDSRHILAIWTVELLSDRFLPDEREIAELRWLTPAELRGMMPSLPSNEVVLRMLGL